MDMTGKVAPFVGDYCNYLQIISNCYWQSGILSVWLLQLPAHIKKASWELKEGDGRETNKRRYERMDGEGIEKKGWETE